jgi:hypothetical protein
LVDVTTIILFAVFLSTMLLLTKVVFRFDDSLRKAGYVFAILSSLLAAVLLTDSSLLLGSMSTLGAAAWLLIGIGVVPVILLAVFVVMLGLKIILWSRGILADLRRGDALDEIWPEHHFNINFAHAISQPHVVQTPSHHDANDLQISDVGRDQIRQLIEVDRAEPDQSPEGMDFGLLPLRRHRWPSDLVA